ncbi:HNH endonuclease [Kitasatospora terrestris]|uniref:HNH nuclease domain-containing protein n=1 Tax=Kitasatospora terrestris TaxID=258051 RepID=A0ABP9E5K4_9ACTN
MGIRDLTDVDAVLSALREFDDVGQKSFLETHGFRSSTRYYLQHADCLYDPKAIAGVAHGYQHGKSLAYNDFHGGEASTNAVLRRLGFTVLSGIPSTIEEERAWRFTIWKNLCARQNADGLLSPGDLRAVNAYGSQQGIWVDKARTEKLSPVGLAVGLKHTGVDYPDEVDDEGALYHYPETKRAGQDIAEIDATKETAAHQLPVFLISEHGPLRSVRLGWVAGWEDESKLFFITFGERAPEQILDKDHSEDHAFQLEGSRRRQRTGTVVSRPDQARFKIEVFQRYGPRCPLSGVAVPQMIEAAHLRPDAENGSSDPRNGLPMNAALHRAFDAHLFAVHPTTLHVMVRPQGPTLEELGITTPRLALPKLPHESALEWRYTKWLEKNKIDPADVVPPGGH